MSEILIRNMEVEDLNYVMEISMESFTSPWSENTFINELQSENTKYIVAEIDNIIVGYCGVNYLFDEVHVMNIAVSVNYRKNGIGKKLLNYIFNYSVKNNYHNFTLEVRRSNVGAINLYKSLDFIEEGYRKKYYEDTKEDALIMWKYIDENI